MNNKPDIVVIHIGTNDIDFRNVDNGAIVNNTAKNIINIANLCKEYGINEIVISSILPKKNGKNIAWWGRVAWWLATCARKPKVPGSSPAASYAQR